MIEDIERAREQVPVFGLQAIDQVEEPEQIHNEDAVEVLGHNVIMIPIESIRVANPRERSKRKFREIVTNISDVGMKRPITVRPRTDGTYDLVCGQGRLEAFRLLGQTNVPAIIRDVSEEDSLLMSIVENIARKRPTSMETVRHLAELRDRGYSHAEVGKKTGLASNYVAELLHLFDHGEERLLAAVETGSVPISAAIIISRSSDADVQKALVDATEQNMLSVHELHRARELADMRRTLGKTKAKQMPRGSRAITGESVVRAFKREQERQRAALRKAELCEKRLVFAVNAVKLLLSDENFVNLLRAEGMETVPEYLAGEMKRGESNE